MLWPPDELLQNRGVKAAVLYGREDLRIEELTPVPLGPGEVRIKVEAALTCGTDLKVFKRGYHARMIVPPAPFGHELAGTIAELGAQVSGWRSGDRVVAANSAPCGSCVFCLRGQENLCDDLIFLNGAYAESIVVPSRIVARNMLRIQDATDFRSAALTEPLACVVKGIEDARLQAGQKVLVLGAGPIGLMFVALARSLDGAVSVVGRGDARLAKARKLGAEKIIDARIEPDWMNAGEYTGRFDVVIEAIGHPATWEAAVNAVRKGGLVNFFGGCPAGTCVSFDAGLLHYSSLTLLASFHHTPRTIRRALEFIEKGVIRVEDFVDGECVLDQLPALFQEMAAGNRFVKTSVKV